MDKTKEDSKDKVQKPDLDKDNSVNGEVHHKIEDKNGMELLKTASAHKVTFHNTNLNHLSDLNNLELVNVDNLIKLDLKEPNSIKVKDMKEPSLKMEN